MGKDDGACPYCGVLNPYAESTCSKCGEQLPWANWVAGRLQPSAALGAAPNSFARIGGESLAGGSPSLPSGVVLKLVVVVFVLVASYFAITRLSPALRQVAPQAGNNSVVDQFKQVYRTPADK